LPWSELYVATRSLDATFAPYYALLHVVFGGHPRIWDARVFSALCALPTLSLVYAIGTRVFDRRVGFGASLLVAGNSLFLHEAREVRMYGLLLAVETASWLVLLLALERPDVRRWAAFAALAIAACYLHPLATLDVVAQAIAVALVTRDRRALVGMAGAVGATVLAIVPLAMFARNAGSHQISWVVKTVPSEFWQQFRGASGGNTPAYIGLACLVPAVALALRSRDARVRLLLAWLAAPIALGLVVSVTIQPVFVARYFIEAVPAAALLIAAFVVAIRNVVARVALAAILAFSAVPVLVHLHDQPSMDWRVAARLLDAYAHPGDPVLIYPYGLALTYDVAREDELARTPSLRLIYPPATAPFWRNDDRLRSIDVRPGSSQVWLIARPEFAALGEASLRARYRLANEIAVYNLVVRRYVPR